MRALLLAGIAALVWAGSASAQTFTDTWSFNDQNGGTVAGTLSGIQNGSGLDAYGLTATVTQASYAALLGSYTIDANGSALASYNTYSAADGLVTFANFALETHVAGNFLYFGTDPSSENFPEVVNYSGNPDLRNENAPDTFAVLPTTVPEPAALTLLGLPLGLLGLVGMWRRRGAARA